jgi:DNA-binding response OmpR family regulator
MTRILIVEDEGSVANFVEKGLRAHGYSTAVVRDGATALTIGRDEHFDLMILDLGLPGVPGLEVLRTLRGSGVRMPVIVLTGRDGMAVAALDAGADDYITKPFDVGELLARIRARVRSEAVHAPAGRTVLTVGDMTLDLLHRCVRIGERTVDLTSREFSIAEVLFRNAGQILSRAQLLAHAWGYDFYPESNVVDAYIGLLRRKLGARAIETVRGMGYRLRAGPAAPTRPLAPAGTGPDAGEECAL